MHNRLLVLAAALAFAAGAHAQLHEFSQAGTLKIDGGPVRGATLHAACSPDKDGGALSIELIVLEANTRKDFDYDDFEGPDAAAGGKALSHLAWTAGSGTTEITSTAAGWYAPEPPQSFMLGVNQRSLRVGAPAKLLAAIGAEPGKLVWTQTGFDQATRKLVATFEFDTAAAMRLHNAVAACLPGGKSD
ncbi:MAG TPA: hypothetical protein VFE67_09950 [Rudaea sp.]|jgi:hypothetical protein|nr:hypothetical protein [Rudaea sp.]